MNRTSVSSSPTASSQRLAASIVTVAAAFVLAAGCGNLASVEDSLEPGPTTTTVSPTEPPTTVDGGGPADDGGAPVAVPHDAGVSDAALDAPVDAPVDAADAGEEEEVEDVDPDPGMLPGCTAADFAANDRRAPNASRVIVFPLLGPPLQYAPRCMLIRPGQTVTWKGDLGADPLAPRSQNPPSPITLTAAGNTVKFTFAKKGRYRFGSTTAAHTGMRGAIDVRP